MSGSESFRLTKTIKRPSDSQDVKFDGKLPEHLDFISSGKIGFTQDDIKTAYQNGEIDDVTARFLNNVLAEASVDQTTCESVIRKCRLYMARLLAGMKPGKDLFIEMQELGLKHHVGVQNNGQPVNLDISGYELPAVDLNGAIISGSLRMPYAQLRGNCEQRHSVIGGDVNQSDVVIGGSVEQSDVVIGCSVEQSDAEIGGCVDQTSAEIGRDVYQSRTKIGGCILQTNVEIGGCVYQLEAETGGCVYQTGAKIGDNMYQTDAKIGGDVDQSDAEIGGGVDQSGAEIGGVLKQSGIHAKGGIHQTNMETMTKAKK
jgi:hypothetical protein